LVDLKRFYLQRNEDVSGISGTGRIANGIQFPDGVCCLRWTGKTPTTVIYNNITELEQLHGHDGKTRVVWLDTNISIMKKKLFLTSVLK